MDNEILDQLKQYVGKNINEIGEHLKQASVYNHNFFELPNGIILLEEFDEFEEIGDLYLSEFRNNYAYYVGQTDKDGIITSIEYTKLD